MAPITKESDETNHLALLDKLDLYSVAKPWRNPNYKPHPRRNKTLKQLLAEEARKYEIPTSVLPTQNNSGVSTPIPGMTPSGATGAMTPVGGASTSAPAMNGNGTVEKAAQNLSGLAIDGQVPQRPRVTWQGLEATPSLLPKKKYCDITGLPASYTDPKSGLRYHNKEVFQYVRTLSQTQVEQYLEFRGAHTVLK
ncbi:hypothetical protein P152DRAFT_330910 [Eremomyces bilateralis CBS 781.70]|uniref:Vps72/YL1 C-terminal domain-containing protein n=1 Tax=Eremomyces bilateralis CBS 781.70 TaxID=1392243 RepID=A0A6G1G4Q2_9PEZI|nr:uncharacterized protein P152DRAFT_330910 [Eremomyces bilateralis CBS 781.70]KAF1812921.1 hypothetical protein P152DRAFT_330910 [Eremomyces bilateralis CBS 781.70]